MKSLLIIIEGRAASETTRLAVRESAGLEVLGYVDGRRGVRRLIARRRPDVVLVDEGQDPDASLERIRECRLAAPGTPILLLGARMDEGWIARAVAAGADACLSRSMPPAAVGTLIRELAEGRMACARPRAPREATLPGPAEQLTKRELEILGLVADGMTNAQIGRDLWVTEQTVKFHLSNVYRKLGVSNRTGASRFAHVAGLAGRSELKLVA